MRPLLYLLLLAPLFLAHVVAIGRAALVQRQDSSLASQPTSVQVSNDAAQSASASAGELNESLNVTVHGPIYPPSVVVQGVTEALSPDFSIDCVECSLFGNFSLSAGGKYGVQTLDTPDDVRKGAPNFNFNDHWVAVTVDQLNASFELELDLMASTSKKEFTIPLNSLTKSLKHDVLTLTATLNAAIHGSVSSSSDVNFTYGFTFAVPAGSEVIIDLSNTSASTSVGFDQSILVPSTFNATKSDFDIELEISFKPSLTLAAAVDILVADASVDLDVGLDIPKLNVEIKEIHNVDSSCNPAPASLPSDQVWPDLVTVIPKIGFDVFEVFSESASFFGVKLHDQQPFNQSPPEIPLPTACAMFNPGKKSMFPVPAGAKTSAILQLSEGMQAHAPLVAALLITGILFWMM